MRQVKVYYRKDGILMARVIPSGKGEEAHRVGALESPGCYVIETRTPGQCAYEGVGVYEAYDYIQRG